ncbi:MAG: M56 family metallopeptidase [Longimicrobiaceae bacterium]
MIAHWIAYCAAIGMLLALGGLALERALRAAALPTRWAWLAAMLLTLAIPAAMRALPREAPPVAPLRVAAPAGAAGERLSPFDLPLEPSSKRRVDLAALDRPLLLAWGAASGATLLALLAMAAVLRRRRSGWRAAELAGVPVLISRDTGPAVVGLVRSRIVLPEWAAESDPEQRALLLEHETEHLRAGDPRLLAVGLAALVLAPWNPAVWWQLRRLRLAMEIDCDARVLRRRGDVRAYGSLLLEVGRRASGSALAVAAFSEPASFLERRIRIMTMPRERSPWTRAAGFGVLALGLAAAACETPAPTSLSPLPVKRVYAAADAPNGLQPAELTPRAAVERFYPEILTRSGHGIETVVFVVSHEGEVVDRSIGRHLAPSVRGSFEALPDAQGRVRSLQEIEQSPDAIETVDVIRFEAGKMGPDPLDMLWIRLRDPSAPPSQAKVRMPAGSEEVVVYPGEGQATLRRTTPQGQEEVRGAHLQVGGEGRVVVRSAPDTGGTRTRVELRSNTITSNGTTVTTGVPVGAQQLPAVEQAVVVRAVQRYYASAVARGGATPEMIWFVAGADGEVVRTGRNGDGALNQYTPDQIAAVDVFKGDRIRLGGEPVSVLWIRLKA